jgi:hypothetical protein
MRAGFLQLLAAALSLALWTPEILRAQRAGVVEGNVRDSLTGNPLPYASVFFEASSQGTATDLEGDFLLTGSQAYTRLTVRALGYETKTIPLDLHAANPLHILLAPTSYRLENVVVRPGKERYRRRNNPAVDLLRKVIARKDQNHVGAQNEYSVEVYEKLSLALDYTLKNYTDTSIFTGKPILWLSVRESVAEQYYRKNPHEEKIVVRASRQQGIDRTLDESGTISGNLKEIFPHVDIFSNDIALMINRFVSPLSSTLATASYKYYLLDTLDVDGEPCVSLAFAPFNPQGYAFSGILYITLDGSYALRKAQLNAPRNIQLNWVDRLRIEQDFARTGGGTWALSAENIYATFSPMPRAPQLYAHRLRSFGRYNVAPGASLPPPPDDATAAAPFRWEDSPVPLSEKEKQLPALLDELKKIKAFNVGVKMGEILISDYISTHPRKEESRFDFGPMSSTFSSNYVEGFRARTGGMTTANLHPHLMLAGYMAYGQKDRLPKYQAVATWNFAPRKYHGKEFPMHYLSLEHTSDTEVPGRHFLFTGSDHIALSFGAGQPVSRMQYIRRTALRYEKEWLSHLSVSLWAKREYNEAAGALVYRRLAPDGSAPVIKGFRITEAGLRLRYAPGEKAYNSRKGRQTVFNLSKDAPIFTLSHQTGLGIGGGEYRYHHTGAGLEKRFWLSSFGHIDAIWRAGYLWSRVPFPLLIIPNANPSPGIQAETFAMMRPLEFVADRHLSFFLTYYLKGWILSRLPLVRRLALREVVSVNGMYGSLSGRNNPQRNPEGLFAFPSGTIPLGATPYMEASIGLDNIFRILRIDYYRRLTYRDNPGAPRQGFRFALRFSF